jgi:hypothetical protein
MGKKAQRIIFQSVLAVAVVVLQVLGVRVSFLSKPLLNNLEFGLNCAGYLIAMEGLSILSGLALAWFPEKTSHNGNDDRRVNIGWILFFAFTFLLVIIRVLLMGFGVLWSVDFFMTVMSPHSAFGEWVYLTQIPALLAGFSLGRLLRR